ncbi:MAG TPA: c-type cytochrome [Nitrospiraceae bacterium]|nr:c-type cytochrome [Nitrospiraceae bacterium]
MGRTTILIMKTGLVFVLAVMAVVLGAVGWVGYETLVVGFSAKGNPSTWEVAVIRQLRRASIPPEQREKLNPVPVSAGVLAQARGHFADHCAACHANDGSGQTPIGQNFYPKPPDMRLKETQSLSDGELAFMIHNGIRFTGMPAWGTGTLADDIDSWALVHFIRHLPNLTSDELEDMKALNPKTKHEREEEASFDRFLQGDDSTPSPPSEHHH